MRPIRASLALAFSTFAATAAAAGSAGLPQTCSGPSLPFYAYAVRGGERLAVYHGPDFPDYYATFGLVNLALRGHVLMENAGTLRLSRDFACTWEDLAAIPAEHVPLHLVAAPGGAAYGFTLNGSGFYEITTDGTRFTVTSHRAPTGNLLGVGVDPADARHVHAGGADGQIQESRDGGATWVRHGTPPGPVDLAYRFAFDPADPRHAIFGAASVGGWVTFDEGASWSPIEGLSATDGPVNLFNAVFSPADGNVAWAMALDIDQADSGGRHFYLSQDGGRTFTPEVDESPDVTITNGPEITPHPRRPLRFAWVFGSSFSGLDIYQYDAQSGRLNKNHYPGLLARTAAYGSVDARNLIIGLEGGIPFETTSGD